MNTAKTGITSAQVTTLSNTSGTNTGDQDISGIAINTSAIAGLGTASAYNVGTGADNVVQLDASSKLPAVDGSQLTNVIGDDMGDHTATENLKIGANYINNNSEDQTATAKGLTFDADGNATFMQDVKINGDFTVPSDARLKDHIQIAQGMLGKISQLNGVSYQYINQNKYAKGTRYGFIAQELKKQFPEMVKQGRDGFYSVDYLQMTAVLLQAIKEQQQMINELMNYNRKLITND